MRLLKSHGVLLATSALAVLIGGCTLSSPYVRYPEEKVAPCGAEGCSVDAAMAYSRATRLAYRDVLDHYARLRSNSGVATITLGAMALAAAAGNANRDVLTALGLVGAAQYGYATWYSNPPRETLFSQTIQALVCAESATGQLRFPPSAVQTGESLRVQAATVSSDIDRAGQALSAAVSELQLYETSKASQAAKLPEKSKQRKAADFDLETIKGVLDQKIKNGVDLLAQIPPAQEALNSALVALLARERAADNAGYALVSAVDRIVAATDAEAQKTSPDPAAAFAVVAGLGGVAGKITPATGAVSTLKAAADASLQKQSAPDLSPALNRELQPMLGRLDTAQFDLATAVSRLAGLTKMIASLAALPTPGAVTAVDKCTIAGIGPLGSVPAAVSVAAGKSASLSVDLQGGKTPYHVEFEGSAPTGLELSEPGFGDSRFVVIGKPESKPGNSTIKVTDGSGRLLEIEVTVK